MVEQLKHECGVAMIRLLKPLSYYERKYGTWRYGLNKLYLLMEKQHNRGQEGAGVACVNMDAPAGTEYMFRERAEGKDAITEIFKRVDESFAGQLYMGHLRYSTTGKSGLQFVHPFLRRNNWRAKNLCLCGNFNMTNIDEVFQLLTDQGQSPRIYGDSYITLELMGHRLDREVERLFQEAKEQGLQGRDITQYIDNHVQMANVLRTTMPHFDGGYVMCGLTGSGEMFAVRDPWGIRLAFYYQDDEVIALASERPVLQTTFDLQCEDICELKPGEALIVRRNGKRQMEQIMPPRQLSACSFERIYFSRGSDRDIYQERKRLGEQLTPAILKAIDNGSELLPRNYPASVGLPAGAAVMMWNGAQFVPQTTTTTLANISSIRRYAYPAELYYYANSLIKTSNTDDRQLYFPTESSWDNILVHYEYDNSVVSKNTTAVAIKEPLQYGVACLQLGFNSDMPSTLSDADGSPVSIVSGHFPLTGIIVGSQRPVGFDFTPLSDSDVDTRFIYDSNPLSGSGQRLFLGQNSSEPTNTLVLQTCDGEEVTLILEFQNNSGSAFRGLNGVVYPGTRFYLIGSIEPKASPVADYEKRVFTQDYTTKITATAASLANAYNVMPDILKPHLEIGVQMVPQWTMATPTNVEL